MESTVALRLARDPRRTATAFPAVVALLIIVGWPLQSLARQVSQEPDQFGSIEGLVVDVEGTPVQGVTVTGQYEGPIVGRLPTSNTGVDGRFRLESVIPGWVRLTTSKPEDGYPNTMWGGLVGPDNADPEVFVSAGDTTSGVVVLLGPRCGKLTGTILDASTGKPLLTARLRLVRDELPPR